MFRLCVGNVSLQNRVGVSNKKQRVEGVKICWTQVMNGLSHQDMLVYAMPMICFPTYCFIHPGCVHRIHPGRLTWNLQPSPMKRKENGLPKPPLLCSMLIFRGVNSPTLAMHSLQGSRCCHVYCLLPIAREGRQGTRLRRWCLGFFTEVLGYKTVDDWFLL